MKKSIITAAILAATTSGFTVSALAAPLSVDYVQDSGFVFQQTYTGTAIPQARDIGIQGLLQPLGGDQRFESLWWGDDNPIRGQVGPSTPIVTQITNNAVTSATPAPWTTNQVITGVSNGLPDSALKIVSLSGTMTSGQGYVPISHAFHSNQTINDDATGLLTSGTIRSLLNLSIGGNPLPAAPTDVAFSFFETPNQQAIYNCPQSTVSCDIFQFPTSGFLPEYFNYGGSLYEISFALIGVSPNAYIINPGDTWGNSYCKAGNLCVLTEEKYVNWLTVGMQLNEVPEPGSLALMGLGLFGAGAALRRRKNRS